MKLYNHIVSGFSELEWSMVKHIPEGGNWKNIPESIPSQRLTQIRASGGRTTYYGRLVYDRPSYTITTYFNRLGNGCNLHPTQDRVLSNREAARLQSFPDNYIFKGSKTSQYKQIGNAVPPLLGYLISDIIKPHLESVGFVDLFAGAGGISHGFIMNGFDLLAANEIEKNYFETYIYNHKKYVSQENLVLGDISNHEVKNRIINRAKKNKIGVVVGGPPCQGFSTAGKRDPNDQRNKLFKEFVDVVNTLKPEFFVLENVVGLLSMQGGKVIDEIISDFRKIGYFVNEPIRLNAEEYGVPQKRKRVVIIGSIKDVKLQIPKPMFSESDSSLPKLVTVRDAIESLPQILAGDNVEIKDYSTGFSSLYDRLMKGDIDFKEFYAISRL